MTDKKLTVRPGRSLPVVRKPRKVVTWSPREHYTQRVFKALEDIANGSTPRHVDMKRAQVNVHKYSEEFLKLAASELAGESEDVGFIATSIANGKNEHVLRLSFAFNDALPGMNYRRANDHAQSLSKYTHPNVPPVPTAPEEIQPEHIALIKVTHAMMEREEIDYPYGRPDSVTDPLRHCGVSSVYVVQCIAKDDLIDLTLSQADDVQLLTDLIKATGVVEASHLSELIEIIEKHPESKQRVIECLATGTVTRAVEIEALITGDSIPALIEGTL